MKNPLHNVVLLLCVSFSISVWFAASAQAADLDVRLQTALTEAGSAERIPVIVTFRDGVELSSLSAGPRHQRRAELVRQLRNQAATVQQPAREWLRSRGTGPINELWIINGLAVTATPETIRALAARPEVLSVRYDEVISLPRVSPSLVSGPAEPNIEQVNAPALWNLGFAGQGVTVATMDSGVDINHPDLAPRWRGGSNSWFNPIAATCSPIEISCTACDRNTTTPCDEPGSDDVAHGTGVMGVLVGGNNSGNYIGVAPEAQWIAVKTFNSTGDAPFSVIHAGFQWLLDPDGNPATDDAPDVVNNSWGFEASVNQCITEFQPDVQRLKDAGIAVAFAAGNQGAVGGSSSISPANNTNAFAVGSVNVSPTPTLSNFSSRGPSPCDSPGTVFPEVVAPGTPIRTADYTFGGTSPNAFITLAGTSLAAPHVSGVMALLLSAFPETRVEALETVLKESSIDLGLAGADNNYGFGMVNAAAAFNLLNDALLGIVDPVAPADDQVLPYGHIPVGSATTRNLTLRNDGSGFLSIGAVRITGASPPFTLAGNSCTQVLAAGASCTITVRFAPAAHLGFNASLEVPSNGSASSTTSVSLSGFGNSPPPVPQPVAPIAGATDLVTPVVLQWNQPADADGDTVVNQVFLATSADFSQSIPLDVSRTMPSTNSTLLAGAGGFFLLFVLAAGNGRKTWRLLATGLLVAALMLLLSCGGGGGGGGDGTVAPAGERSLELTGLAPATTYFWKVSAEDNLGGRTESPVRSFTTR